MKRTRQFPINPSILFVVYLTLMLVVFIWQTQRHPIIGDSIGYVMASQSVAEGRGLAHVDERNAWAGRYFSPFAFQIRREEGANLYFGYPPGLPLLLGAGISMSGAPEAALFGGAVLSMLGLTAVYLLTGKITNNRWTALLSTLLIGLIPIYFEFGTAPWSEVPTLAFASFGILLFIYSRTTNSVKRSLLYSIGAAILLGFSLFIRYANVTLLLGLFLFDVADGGRNIWSQRRRFPFWIGIGISFVAILLFNNVYYGGYLLTSYHPANGWYTYEPFSFAYALGPAFAGGYSLEAVAQTLWGNLGWLLLLVPLGWAMLPRPYTLLLFGSAIGLLGLYTIYAFPASGINARFVIPALPFLVIGIGHGVMTVVQRANAFWVKGLVVTAVLLYAASSLPSTLNNLQARNAEGERIATHFRRVANLTEEDAVIISHHGNDYLTYYGNRSTLNSRRIPPADEALDDYDYEYLEPCLVQTIDRLLAQGVPVYILVSESNWLDEWVYTILEENYQLGIGSTEQPNLRPVMSDTAVRENPICP